MRNLKMGLAALALALVGALVNEAATAEREPQKNNMELVGYHDLQGRSAYQPVIQKQGRRWIAYIGHHAGSQPNPLTGKTEDNGTSILDVTDPARPTYLAHIPGEPGQGESGGAQMVRVCNGTDARKAGSNSPPACLP